MGGLEFIRRVRAANSDEDYRHHGFQNLADTNQLSKYDVYACLLKPCSSPNLRKSSARRGE